MRKGSNEIRTFCISSALLLQISAIHISKIHGHGLLKLFDLYHLKDVSSTFIIFQYLRTSDLFELIYI